MLEIHGYAVVPIVLADLIDRMPVIVHQNDYDLWMKGEPAEVAVLLRPYPCDDMTARPLSPLVNNSRNEGPDLLN